MINMKANLEFEGVEDLNVLLTVLQTLQNTGLVTTNRDQDQTKSNTENNTTVVQKTIGEPTKRRGRPPRVADLTPNTSANPANEAEQTVSQTFMDSQIAPTENLSTSVTDIDEAKDTESVDIQFTPEETDDIKTLLEPGVFTGFQARTSANTFVKKYGQKALDDIHNLLEITENMGLDIPAELLAKRHVLILRHDREHSSK